MDTSLSKDLREEKINLRTLLSTWVSLREIYPGIPLVTAYVCIESAWAGVIDQYAMCTEDVQESLSILDGISTVQGNELIRALSEQISQTR